MSGHKKQVVPPKCHEKGCEHPLGAYPQYCAKHTDLHNNLQVKKSKIKGAGKGLFVGSKPIKNGGVVARYGYSHNYKSAKEIEDTCQGYALTDVEYNKCYGDYIFCDGEHCWDAREKRSTLARYANDAHGSKYASNAQFKMKRGVPYIVASADIQVGEEVFVDYGDQYW